MHIACLSDYLNREIIMSAANSEATEQLVVTAFRNTTMSVRNLLIRFLTIRSRVMMFPFWLVHSRSAMMWVGCLRIISRWRKSPELAVVRATVLENTPLFWLFVSELPHSTSLCVFPYLSRLTVIGSGNAGLLYPCSFLSLVFALGTGNAGLLFSCASDI